MKNRTQLILIILSLLFFFNCDKDIEPVMKLIKSYDIELMTLKNLPQFIFKNEYTIETIGTEYLLTRISDSIDVNIIFGIHDSKENAEIAALSYMNEISAVHNSEALENIKIGDKYWWLGDTPNTDNIIRFVFIRYNSLFIIESFNFDLETLAKKIDDDILNRESYITFK